MIVGAWISGCPRVNAQFPDRIVCECAASEAIQECILFILEELLVVGRRSSDRLGGIAHQNVNGVMGGQLRCESLQGWEVREVNAIDVQPFDPLGGIGLLQEALRGTTREPRRCHHERAAPQQHQASFVADFATATCDDGCAPGQVLTVCDALSVAAQATLAHGHLPLRRSIRHCRFCCPVRRLRCRHAAAAHIATRTGIHPKLESQLWCPIPPPFQKRQPPTYISITRDDLDVRSLPLVELFLAELCHESHNICGRASGQVDLVIAVHTHCCVGGPSRHPAHGPDGPLCQAPCEFQLFLHAVVDLDVAARLVSAELVDQGATSTLGVLGHTLRHLILLCGELVVAHEVVAQFQGFVGQGSAPHSTAVIGEGRAMHVGECHGL
mmetsp:Transcript_10889/g.28949  ORF Transcript_10889/g.28949 Transcript_10889/m.28949 type:complete len:383 (+) Transcript_10889:1089-2237(+)